MIKTQVLVKRRADLSREDFADYWMRVHVPITSRLPGLCRQTVSIVRPDRQRAHSPWDGLANSWWDSFEALTRLRESDAYRAMIEDEQAFVDRSAYGPLVVEEVRPFDGPQPPAPTPEIIKIVNPLARKSGMSPAEFSAYWRGPHAELNRSLPGMLAYVQNHLLPGHISGRESADGIAEAWYANWEDVLHVARSPALAAVSADEPNLLAPDSLRTMICREIETFRR